MDLNDRTEEEQLAVVKRTAYAIKHIKNPSEAVQLAAVAQDGFAICYVIDNRNVPSEAVQMLAVKQDVYTIHVIRNPAPAVIKAALTNSALVHQVLEYEYLVNKLFADNALLMKKWIRYGETMRNQQ
jgi:hypothetical protein